MLRAASSRPVGVGRPLSSISLTSHRLAEWRWRRPSQQSTLHAQHTVASAAPQATSKLSELDGVLAGLAASEPWIDPRFQYDAHGSELYEKLCRSDAYFLTRVEHGLLSRYAAEIVCPAHDDDAMHAARADTRLAITELSAGNGEKVAQLVAASARAHALTDYCPIDISEGALLANKDRIQALGLSKPTRDHVSNPSGGLGAVTYTPLQMTNEEGLAAAAARLQATPKLFLLLGGGIGNAADATAEFTLVSRHMSVGDRFMLGVALPPADSAKAAPTMTPETSGRAELKTIADVERAYNDIHLHQMLLNALLNVNREAGTDLNVDDFVPEAYWCEDRCATMQYVVARRDMKVLAADGNLIATWTAGTRVLVDVSRRYSGTCMMALGSEAGLEYSRHWESDDGSHMLIEFVRPAE